MQHPKEGGLPCQQRQIVIYKELVPRFDCLPLPIPTAPQFVSHVLVCKPACRQLVKERQYFQKTAASCGHLEREQWFRVITGSLYPVQGASLEWSTGVADPTLISNMLCNILRCAF